VHLPPAAMLKDRQIPMDILDSLPVRSEELLSGLRIGTGVYEGLPVAVCIPPELRACAVHLIGKPGRGKSMLMECCALQDIAEGRGVIVLDPHGDLVERLLRLIPQNIWSGQYILIRRTRSGYLSGIHSRSRGSRMPDA